MPPVHYSSINVYESGMGEGKAKKRPMSAAQKARHEKHQKLLKVTGAKKSKAQKLFHAIERKLKWTGANAPRRAIVASALTT